LPMVPAGRALPSKTYQIKVDQTRSKWVLAIISLILGYSRLAARVHAHVGLPAAPPPVRRQLDIRAFADYQSAIQPRRRRGVGALRIRRKAVTEPKRTRAKGETDLHGYIATTLCWANESSCGSTDACDLPSDSGIFAAFGFELCKRLVSVRSSS
jgi:hypothetical protein